MAVTKNLTPTTKISTLGTRLANDETALAIAEAGKFNVVAVVEARELKRDLMDELDVKVQLREEWAEMKGKKYKALVKEIDTTIVELQLQITQVVEYPTIGQLSRQDKDDIQDTLRLLLIDLYDWFAESETEDRINQMIDLVIANYGGLTLEEFTVFLSQVIDGKFAQVFSLKPVYIMRWLKKFRDDLQTDAIQRNTNRHLQVSAPDHRSVQDYHTIPVDDTRINGKITKQIKKLSGVGDKSKWKAADERYFKER